MTREEIQAEVSKLNASQKAVLRTTVGQGNIEALSVTKIGHKTQVDVTMYGVRQMVTLGSRGMVLAREVAA